MTIGDVKGLTPPQFFDHIVQAKLNARGPVEGLNFFFGRDRAGDISTLRSLCKAAGISLDVMPAVRFDDRMVSSSAVCSAIADGRIAVAVELLCHPFRVRVTVVRGASIGFPTANLENVETFLPADGVHAGRTYDSGRSHPAAINVGSNPTFNDLTRKLEVHLIASRESSTVNRSTSISWPASARPSASRVSPNCGCKSNATSNKRGRWLSKQRPMGPIYRKTPGQRSRSATLSQR